MNTQVGASAPVQKPPASGGQQSVSIDSRLRQAREALGISRQELAQRCGFGFGTIEKYETGHREPSVKNLVKICRALGVSVDEVVADLPSPPGLEPVEETEVVRQRRLLQQLADSMGVKVTINPAAQPAPQSTVEPAPGPAELLDDLTSFVANETLAARSLPARITAVELALKELEYSDLYDLAKRRGIDVTSLPESDADATEDALVASETVLESFLLCDALYGDAWRNADVATLEAAGIQLSETVLSGARAYAPRKSSLRMWWDESGDEESDDDYLMRVRSQVSPHLVTGVKKRRPATFVAQSSGPERR